VYRAAGGRKQAKLFMVLLSRNWRLFIAAICIATGAWVLSLAITNRLSPPLHAEKIAEMNASEPGFPVLSGHYQAQSIERYKLQQGEEVSLPLNVVSYPAADGTMHRATLYLADNATHAGTSTDTMQLRQELWHGAMAALNQHADENALFLSWWDDAQRIDWFTGRSNWVTAPAAAAFANVGEQRLWTQIAGPFPQDETRLRQLARWLTMNAQDALTEMSNVLPRAIPVYFLACLDDLARLAEIERLSGKKLAFGVAQFPRTSDIHAQIAEVKRWAHEKGNGSYLIQNIPGGGIRAWRIEDTETENTLLAKLLPFTSSMENTVATLETVYQSPWASYLTVFRWNR
jgi:hydroxylamine oxidation protein HaoB